MRVARRIWSCLNDLPNLKHKKGTGNNSSSSHRKRNVGLTAAFLVLVLCAILNLPYEPFNSRLTPDSEAIFTLTTIGDQRIIGTVDLKGKGGLSAGNHLTITVMFYVNETLLNQTAQSVWFSPNAAYIYPIVKTDRGFPLVQSLSLTHEGDKWVGQLEVTYNQGGMYGVEIKVIGSSLDNPREGRVTVVPIPNVVHISDEDVTVSAKTNALLLSLELAIVALACLELRIEDHRNQSQTCKGDQASDNHKAP